MLMTRTQPRATQSFFREYRNDRNLGNLRGLLKVWIFWTRNGNRVQMTTNIVLFLVFVLLVVYQIFDSLTLRICRFSTDHTETVRAHIDDDILHQAAVADF